MVDDILDMFKVLDNIQREDIRKFMCDDASKLPPCSPEDAGSMMAVMESITALQRHIQQMHETMCTVRLDIENTKKSVDDYQNTITIDDLKQTLAGIHNVGDQDASLVMPSAVDQGGSGKYVASSTSYQGGNCRHYVNTVLQTSDKEQLNDGFQKGGKRKNKGMNKELKDDKSARSKPTRTSGTSDSLILSAGPQIIQVQITNVNKELDADSIKEFLNNKELGIEVSNGEEKTSDGWQTK